MSEWTTILDDLTAYLRWSQERGLRTAEFDPETAKAFLSGAPARPAPRGAPAPAPAPRLPSAGRAAVSTAALPPGEEEPAPRTLPDDTPDARLASLAAIREKVAKCEQCELCRKRKQVVPGQGNALSPDVMFIGEAPGADEDEQGLAFVGAAGQLLTKMIAAMGYTRDEVFIANICKCRPPNNRPPTIDEMQACLPYLRAQIAAIRPKTIVALGATAVKGLLDSSVGISRLRGTWTTYANIPLMPTYHPAYLLRFPPAKKDAWEDLKKVLVRLGRPIPQKKADAAS